MNLLDACRGSRDDFHDYGTLRVTPYSVPFWIASKEVNHAERRTKLASGSLLATRAAMTVITLSSALTAFSYDGLAG